MSQENNSCGCIGLLGLAVFAGLAVWLVWDSDDPDADSESVAYRDYYPGFVKLDHPSGRWYQNRDGSNDYKVQFPDGNWAGLGGIYDYSCAVQNCPNAADADEFFTCLRAKCSNTSTKKRKRRKKKPTQEEQVEPEVAVLDEEPAEPAHPPLTAPSGATRTASGLAFRVLRAGTGTGRPTLKSRVTLQFTGWKSDGSQFANSRLNNTRLKGLMKGLIEGVQLMQVGEKRRFWVPVHLAYGHSSRPGAVAGDLVCDIELVGFE